MRILVVGAGGYVGGRLVPRLVGAGHELTLVTRNAQLVASRFPEASVLAASTLGRPALEQAAARAESVVVLPERLVRHGSAAWAEEVQAAGGIGEVVAAANRADGHARRIVHLGELGDAPAGSAASRPGAPSDVGAALIAAGAPVLELRASLVVGSGSAAFDMVRSLADRFPVWVTPRWVDAQCQPIAIRDVLAYLMAALETDGTGVIEVGGRDVLTFGDMLSIYSRTRGRQPRRIRVPVTAPGLSDGWVSLVTPLPSGLAAAMIDRLMQGTVVREPHSAHGLDVRPMGYADAVRLALERTSENRVETTWYDTFESPRKGPAARSHAIEPGPVPPPETVTGGRRLLVDRRSADVAAPPDRVFAVVERVGGAAGWPAGNVFWRIRGLIDRMVGGVGMRLGRRDQERLRVGDALDFWRVEVVDRPRTLRLRAEMRVPGLAWLQYEVEPTASGSRLVQTAYFDPHGPGGYAYWYLLLPVHVPIFIRTVTVLARRAEARSVAL